MTVTTTNMHFQCTCTNGEKNYLSVHYQSQVNKAYVFVYIMHTKSTFTRLLHFYPIAITQGIVSINFNLLY